MHFDFLTIHRTSLKDIIQYKIIKIKGKIKKSTPKQQIVFVNFLCFI